MMIATHNNCILFLFDRNDITSTRPTLNRALWPLTFTEWLQQSITVITYSTKLIYIALFEKYISLAREHTYV